jgi:hypothetical protein
MKKSVLKILIIFFKYITKQFQNYRKKGRIHHFAQLQVKFLALHWEFRNMYSCQIALSKQNEVKIDESRVSRREVLSNYNLAGYLVC